jgi:hypothetical protein
VRENLLDSIKEKNSSINYNSKKMIMIIKEFNTALNEMKNNLLNILPLEIAVFNIVSLDSLKSKEPRGVLARIPKQQIEKTILKEKSLEKKTNINISNEGKFRLINEKWSDILLKAKDYNHFLTAILTGAKLELINGEIVLKVASSFHKKRIDNVDTKKILLKIISDLTGESIDFQCIIHKESPKRESSTNNEKIVEEIFN